MLLLCGSYWPKPDAAMTLMLFQPVGGTTTGVDAVFLLC